ncbi:MAG: hypothetical protein ACI8SJ_001876 [Shewanella sp.]|jgi:hypothetical protein
MHVTSSGSHGGCKEDKDEQSSLLGCGRSATTLVKRSLMHLWFQLPAVDVCADATEARRNSL